MKKLTIFAVFLLFIFAISCNDNSLVTPEWENHLEITINGETFITNMEGGGYKGISELKTCDNKAATQNIVGTINTANFRFELALFHYPNLSDFENSEVGTNKVGSYILSSEDTSNCNLDALAYLEDKNEDIVYTSLMLGATHKVIQITDLGRDINSTYLDAVKYKIEGELNNLVFINASDKEILVSGKYQAYITIK